MATETQNPWIDWKSGECPVDPDTLVHYRMADGCEDLGRVGTVNGTRAGDLRWVHTDRIADIIAYRVVSA